MAVPASAGGNATARGRNVVLAFLLRFWWVALFAVVGVGGVIFNAQRDDSGEITRGGNLTVTDLRVGDCFDLKDRDEEVTEEVSAKPCSDGHQFEMFHTGDMTGGSSFPTEADFDAWLEAQCLPAYATYVGLGYDESRYDIFWFTPTPDGWDQGDRTVQCAIYDPLQSELTASLRGSAR